MLQLRTNIQNQAVDVYFEFTGRDGDSGINWDTLVVEAFLPQRFKQEPVWVVVTDLLSDEDTKKIEETIYANWRELEDQYLNNQDGEP